MGKVVASAMDVVKERKKVRSWEVPSVLLPAQSFSPHTR